MPRSPALSKWYDPVADAWATKASMPTPRNGMAFGTIGGLIYVAGGQANGYVPQAVLEVYDPVADTWTTKAPMSTALRSLAGAALNGKLYATGGIAGGAGSTATVASVEVYDPSTNMWTPGSPMPLAREGHCAAAVNGLFYMVGGASNTNVAADDLTYAMAMTRRRTCGAFAHPDTDGPHLLRVRHDQRHALRDRLHDCHRGARRLHALTGAPP